MVFLRMSSLATWMSCSRRDGWGGAGARGKLDVEGQDKTVDQTLHYGERIRLGREKMTENDRGDENPEADNTRASVASQAFTRRNSDGQQQRQGRRGKPEAVAEVRAWEQEINMRA